MQKSLQTRSFRSHDARGTRLKSLVSHIRDQRGKEKDELKVENQNLKLKVNEIMLINKKISSTSMLTKKEPELPAIHKFNGARKNSFDYQLSKKIVNFPDYDTFTDKSKSNTPITPVSPAVSNFKHFDQFPDNFIAEKTNGEQEQKNIEELISENKLLKSENETLKGIIQQKDLSIEKVKEYKIKYLSLHRKVQDKKLNVPEEDRGSQFSFRKSATDLSTELEKQNQKLKEELKKQKMIKEDQESQIKSIVQERNSLKIQKQAMAKKIEELEKQLNEKLEDSLNSLDERPTKTNLRVLPKKIRLNEKVRAGEDKADDELRSTSKQQEKQFEIQQTALNESLKDDLKLISETLYYKFLAQSYSYDYFLQDMKLSQTDRFYVEDLVSVFQEDPFKLPDLHIETLLIYLFGTEDLEYSNYLSAQMLGQRMKPIIGRANRVDQQLKVLCTVVENDFLGEKRLKRRFKQESKDSQYLTKDQFVTIMSQFDINDKVLETAIAKIAILSQDLNHLNYDKFLQEFDLDY